MDLNARLQASLSRATQRVSPLAPPSPTTHPSPNPIARLLSTSPMLILDGALATELESRGLNLSDPLWSCTALHSHPKLIEQIHREYFSSGADIAITASYQASVPGLQKHKGLSEAAALELIRRSVTLARNAARSAAVFERRDRVFQAMGARGDHATVARDAVRGAKGRELLVAGSVGPYGAYLADGSEYRGDYSVSAAELAAFHRPRMRALVEMGVDLLACETLPSVAEVKVLSDLLRQEFPGTYAWFSFTLRDAVHLSDGTPLKQVCEVLQGNEQVAAIGVNCVPPQLAGTALRHMSTFVSVPLVVYPNSGETWDAQGRQWANDPGTSTSWPTLVQEWREAGAKLIGGCCRTSPADIEVISSLA